MITHNCYLLYLSLISILKCLFVMSVDSNGSWTSIYLSFRGSPEKVLIVYYCLYGVPVLGSLLLGGVSHYEVSGRRPGTTQGALGSDAW